MQNYMKTILSAVKFYIDKIAAKIPTKTSQLENDLNFATEDYVNNTINDSIEENDNNLIVKYNENRLKLLFDEESYEILNGKISDLATYEYMVSASDVKNRPSFLFNIEKNLSDYNEFDYYFVQVKLPIDGKNYYSNGYAKFNKGARVTFMQPFGGYDYIQLMTIQKVEKIYENADSNSLIDAHGKCCVRIEPYHYYSTIEEAEILAEIIRNAEVTIYCGRLNNLALDNTFEYTPTGNYNPATKKYVDDKVQNIDLSLYETIENASTKLEEAKDYADQVKSDILGGAPKETLDTITELATAFEENKEVVEALDASITNKQDKISDALILVDTETGIQHKIQIKNGRLVSFPVTE